jgi:galactose mutarotase-like enzyme
MYNRLMENSYENYNLKIETIKTPEGDEVSICPERGGIITSIKLKGKEILYLDEETLKNKDINVKGGIPILFPNAGPIESQEFPNLKQHGFARDSSQWKIEKLRKGFKETLMPEEKNIESYPYSFQLSLEGSFEENGSFAIVQEVKNLEEYKELPLSFGLHPYFKVSNKEKRNVRFNFEGGKLIEEQVETWANGKAVSIDNPKINDPSAIIEVTIPNLGTLVIDVSPEYKKIWVWSMSDKDFVCIEPVMRNKGGLVEDPERVKSKEIFSASVSFSLKEY